MWSKVGQRGEYPRSAHASRRIRAHHRRQEPAHPSGQVPRGVRGRRRRSRAGMDGCLYAYRSENWDELVESRLAELDPLSERPARCSGSSSPARPRPSPTSRAASMLPAALAPAARARPGRRHRRPAGPPGDLGPRRLAQAARTRSKGAPRMLPNVLQPSATDSRSRPRRGGARAPRGAARARRSSTAPSAPAATRACSRRTSTARAARRDRPRPDRASRSSTRFARHAGVQARFLRGDFAACSPQLAGERRRRPTRSCSTSACHRCRSTGPSAASRYAADAPLDMRMDPPRRALRGRARERVRTSASSRTIFRRYGEERYARQIARAIVRRRAHGADRDARGELVDVDQARRSRRRRASATAIRPSASSRRCASPSTTSSAQLEDGARRRRSRCCRPGGRLAVITFHSLEDRIVKRLPARAERGCICPPDLPVCGCGKEPELRAADAEGGPAEPRTSWRHNPRAASARLRAVQEGLGSAAARAAARAHPSPRAASATEAAACRDRPAPPRRGRRRLDRASSRSCSPGVVALNVAVLRLNMRLDELAQRAVAAPAQTTRARVSSSRRARRPRRIQRWRGSSGSVRQTHDVAISR